MTRRFPLACATAFAAALAAPAHAQTATDTEMMSVVGAIVRAQGNPCTSPTAISRDASASSPDEPVFEITCREGIYTVRVAPDMASTITRKDNSRQTRP